MTLDQQITRTCRAAYFQIRRINSIRQYLSEDAVKTLVRSVVVVRFDYCNSLYIGLPMKRIKRLQTSQNTAARLISRTSRYAHMSLKDLYYIRMKKNQQKKLSKYIYKYITISDRITGRSTSYTLL